MNRDLNTALVGARLAREAADAVCQADAVVSFAGKPHSNGGQSGVHTRNCRSNPFNCSLSPLR